MDSKLAVAFVGMSPQQLTLVAERAKAVDRSIVVLATAARNALVTTLPQHRNDCDYFKRTKGRHP